MTTATKYKTYPKYKPSGIDWLGDIPAEWEVWKYGHLFLTSMGETILREDLVDDGKIPVYSATEENINFGYVDSASVILDKGDLVIPARGNSIGNVKLVDKLSTTTQTTIYSKLIKKNKTDIRYVLYLLKGLKDVYFFFDRTAIPQITVNQVQNNDLCIPPIEDQKSIADFLDRETAKIDEMMAKKQKLINLLKEKRQALITHAVTKGLDPKAKMKPSGIDWLGDIPEGWESWKVAHLFNKIGSGTTPPSDDMDYYEGNIPWVITGELNDNEIFDSENKVTKKAVEELSALKVFPKDSLLIAMYGATIGKMAILRIPATTNQACCILGGSKIIDTNFSFYYFLAFRPHLIALSYGGGQPNISQDTIKSIKIFLPKIDEQKKIVTFLDRETAKIDEMTKKVEMQIEKLQEYRQALITSAVTGKIKV